MVAYALGGHVRRWLRGSIDQEALARGVEHRGGYRESGVSYLLRRLYETFGPMQNEVRLKAQEDWEHLKLHHGETLDMFLTRFKDVLTRAAQ